jgi:hypothetical protein
MGNRREGGGEVADPRIKGGDDESTRESQRLRRGARQMGNGIRVRAMGGTHRGCFYTHIELAALGGLGRCGRCYVGDGLTGPSRAGTVPTVPGHAARQAGVAAHARAWCTGRPARARGLPGHAVAAGFRAGRRSPGQMDIYTVYNPTHPPANPNTSSLVRSRPPAAATCNP